MKKLVATLSMAALLALLAGCSSSDRGSGESSNPGSSSSSPAETAAPAEEAPAPDSNYVVTIDGSSLGADYQGNPALIVDFTFTNNSDEDKSFMFAVDATAFQDGVELESAISTGTNSQDLLKDLRPGATISLQKAWVLNGESDVEIEVTELFKREILVSQVFSVS